MVTKDSQTTFNLKRIRKYLTIFKPKKNLNYNIHVHVHVQYICSYAYKIKQPTSEYEMFIPSTLSFPSHFIPPTPHPLVQLLTLLNTNPMGEAGEQETFTYRGLVVHWPSVYFLIDPPPPAYNSPPSPPSPASNAALMGKADDQYIL